MRTSAVAAVIVCGCVIASAARGQDDLDPKAKAVCAQWKERQDTLPAVRYRYTVETWVAADKDYGTPQRTESSQWVMSLDCKSNRYRLESLQPDDDGFKKRILAFDGKELRATSYKADKSGQPLSGETPKVSVGRGNFESFSPFECGLEQPLLISHGVVPLTPNSFAKPGNIHFLPNAATSFFHRGGGREVFRTYPQGSVKDYREIDTDPSRGGLVLAFKEVSGPTDKPFWVTTLTYRRVQGHDVCGSFKFELIGPSGVQMRNTAANIQAEVLTEPPESEFTLDIREGQLVALHEYSKGQPQLPKSVDSPAQMQNGELVKVTVDPDGTVRPANEYLWWLIPTLVLAAGALAVGVVWAVRRRRPQA